MQDCACWHQEEGDQRGQADDDANSAIHGAHIFLKHSFTPNFQAIGMAVKMGGFWQAFAWV